MIHYRFTRLFPLFFIVLLASSACAPSPTEYKTTIFAFGTLIDITLYDVTSKQANTAFAQMENDFQRDHHNWSPWEDGALARANKQLQQGKASTLPASMVPMIRQAITLSKRSQGAFNPAIGKLINLWQFHKYDRPDIKPPAPERIARLLKTRPEASDIHLRGNNTISSSNPAVQLSLGAFAKGYGIQVELNKLTKMGIKNAIINAGGDLGVRGKHGKRNWNIGIRDPRSKGIIASVKAKSGENVFTSGDYERYYIYQHKRYHHILNPHTGYPTRGFSSVTVIDNDGGVADAAATALMVAGPEKWWQTARSMGIKYAMLIDEHGSIYMNPKMAKRISLTKPGTNHIILSKPL